MKMPLPTEYHTLVVEYGLIYIIKPAIQYGNAFLNKSLSDEVLSDHYVDLNNCRVNKSGSHPKYSFSKGSAYRNSVFVKL